MASSVRVLEYAASYDLTVLATVKEEFGIPASNTSQDAKLSRWISEASEDIADYCGRPLALEKVEETFVLGSANGPTPEYLGGLRLKRWPIVQIYSVSVDGSALAADGYSVDKEKGILTLGGTSARLSWTGRMIVVTYKGGYSLIDGLPRPLERACLNLLEYRYSAGGRDPSIQSEGVPGVYEVRYFGSNSTAAAAPPVLPADVRSRLRRYKDLVAA